MSAVGEMAGPRTRAAYDEHQRAIAAVDRARAALADAHAAATARIFLGGDDAAFDAALVAAEEAGRAYDDALSDATAAYAAWRTLTAEGGTL